MTDKQKNEQFIKELKRAYTDWSQFNITDTLITKSFATLIDELAFTFPDVVFIVSAGNQNPLNIFKSIAEIKNNYPQYLVENPDFKIINPATAALALTVGSIANKVRIIEQERYGAEQIKTVIAKENQPSPFTRTGAGVNGMVKPELVEYGGNLILSNNYDGRVLENKGSKLGLLNNRAIGDIIRFGYGTSFSAPKVAHLAGRIANQFPQHSGLFIKNMLLMGASYPLNPNKNFYSTKETKQAETHHLSICGFGLSDFDRAVNSYSNRTVLWDEDDIGLNKVKVYSLKLPDIFFTESGRKRITITLTFNPETRSSRGDSYLGNRMEFHLFHTVNPDVLIEKYGVISENTEQAGDVPDDFKKFEIDFFPGSKTRNKGCHQKAWKEYKNEPNSSPASPISLVLLNVNKWIYDPNKTQKYCISVTFEHEKEIELYNQLKMENQNTLLLRVRS